MKDRIAGAPGQYSAVVTGGEYQKLQSGQQFAITLTRDDEPVVEGTPYSKAAVLPDALAQLLCPDLEDPSPADAFAALQKEIGSEIFNVNLADIVRLHKDEGFEATDGDWIDQNGCWTYFFDFDENNQKLMGKTLKVKTYMYGEMAVWYQSYLGTADFHSYNQDANIEENPESGICEFEIPIENYDALLESDFMPFLMIAFCENPYFDEPKISIVHDTVWGEIVKIDKHAIESTEHPGCYYRIVNGVTEWINPPMIAGVEYRTTERYAGSVVYAKLVTLGVITSGETTVNWTADTTVSPIRYTARIMAQTLPIHNANGTCVCDVRLAGNKAYVTCSANWIVGETIQLQAFYIK